MEGGAGPGLCRAEPLLRCRRWRPRLRRGSRRPPRLPRAKTSRPAPRLLALFAVRSLGLRGAAQRPHQSAHALPRCPSGLRAAARPRRLSSDQREAQTGAGASAPGPLPDPLTAWHRRQRTAQPSPGPNAAAGAWPRAPEHGQSRQWAGHAARSAPRQPERCGCPASSASPPGNSCSGASPRGPRELSAEEPGVLPGTLRAGPAVLRPAPAPRRKRAAGTRRLHHDSRERAAAAAAGGAGHREGGTR